MGVSITIVMVTTCCYPITPRGKAEGEGEVPSVHLNSSSLNIAIVYEFRPPSLSILNIQ